MDLKCNLEDFMKKVLVFFIVGFVFFSSCSAQNANAQSANDAQRIVGTWRAVDTNGHTYTFTFNANGSYTYSYNPGDYADSSNGNYHIFSGSGSKLFVKAENTESSRFSNYDYYISSNGRVLILIWTNGQRWYEKQ